MLFNKEDIAFLLLILKFIGDKVTLASLLKATDYITFS